MEIEYYDSIDLDKLNYFRQKMEERIFCKKRNDGQKGTRLYAEIARNLNQLENEYRKLISELIDQAEICNIHPNELAKVNHLLSFYSFNELNTIKESLHYDDAIDELPQITSDECEHFEKHSLNELIKKWFAQNGKKFPNDDSDVEFFYDYDMSFILGAKMNCFNNDLEKVKMYESFVLRARIYTYRHRIKSDNQSFNLLVENFITDSDRYRKEIGVLLEELEFSDRGSIMVDRKHPAFIYKLNGQDIYQFTSLHFWEIYDEFISLQINQPDLFGKGTESILIELYKIFSSKNESYWGSFEEFMLKIQQQYLYTASEEKGLRLDLYRNILKGEFQGGIWHSFKHFKSNNKPLSAKSGGGKDYDEQYFFNMLRQAFFVELWCKDKKGRLSVSIPYSTTKGMYKLGFHEYKCLDPSNHVISTLYSLNTVYYDSK